MNSVPMASKTRFFLLSIKLLTVFAKLSAIYLTILSKASPAEIAFYPSFDLRLVLIAKEIKAANSNATIKMPALAGLQVYLDGGSTINVAANAPILKAVRVVERYECLMLNISSMKRCLIRWTNFKPLQAATP